MIVGDRKYGLLDFVGISFQSAPRAAILVALHRISNGLLPTAQILATARFVDTAIAITTQGGSPLAIYPSLVLLGSIIAYGWLSGSLARFAEERLSLGLTENFRSAVTAKRAVLKYAHVENNESWELISRVAKDPMVRIFTSYDALLGLVNTLIRVAGVLTILVTQVWWAAVVILVTSIPLFYVSVKSGKAHYQADRDVTKHRRRADYLAEVLTGRENVEERSVFGYGDRVNDRWHAQYESARKLQFRVQLKNIVVMKAASLITTLISLIVAGVLLEPVMKGQVTVGMFIGLVNAVLGLVQMMSWTLSYQVDRLAESREYMRDLTSFAALKEEDGAALPPRSPAPELRELELRDVHFAYPGTEKEILKGLTLRIEGGRHYAFVGVNGAGKTTVTKLLTGLYREFTGEILVNGRDIRSYAGEELRSIFAVVYQDFARYSIPFGEAIAIGNVNDTTSGDAQARIAQAIRDIGLDRTLAALPHGMETPLGKIKEGAQELSGGEWQRVALARALVSPAPVRILDEPTASLDPVSESRIYEMFEGMSAGKTTLFISHRLGSTKLADLIYVIADGVAIEQGDHADLMRSGGTYAEMFESQREWYQ